MNGFRDWALEWQGVFSLVFMIVIASFLWRTIRLMPKTKPQQIKPDAKQAVTWQEVAGVDEAKEELREVVEFLRDPSPFRNVGATVPAGILLHGPPGTGKTLLAKAVAHESGAQFFSQSASSFVEMYTGLGARRIRRLFREAAKAAPAIIFIDELDAVGGMRGSDNNSEREQTLNQLLVEMDGFGGRERIVVMAASNLLEKLDPALLRPGRFDRQIYVTPPDVVGRLAILEVHTRNKPLHNVELGTIARQTSGLSGAELANLCNEAAIRCARRKGRAISQADFDSAFERVVAGVQSRRALNQHERRVVAFHEAGHALVGELLPGVDRPHRVSIVPRGTALGFAMSLPEEDRYLKTRRELVDQIAVLLAGRTAEQIIFGEITTGAANDLQRVAEITHAMVHQYAMGSDQTPQRAVLDVEAVSDITRRIRDEEQRELAFEGLNLAQQIISRHRSQLEQLAHALLDREALDRSDLDRILGDTRRLRVAAASSASAGT
jgi:cell division protease FtsH